jgi:hypothetical protein
MHYVGAPQITVVDPLKRRESPRNPLFQIRTSDTALSDAANDPMLYRPGELVTLHVRISKRFTESRRAGGGIGGMFACWPQLGMLFHGTTQMCGYSWHVNTGTATPPTMVCPDPAAKTCPGHWSPKFLNEPRVRGKCYTTRAQCLSPHPWKSQPVGNEIQAWETAKYMGILMYAVDENENKVGQWEIVPETPPRFWTPPDPGCDGKALMHADVRLKSFHNIFHWRAPSTPLGLGKKVAFRVLIKHGYTNGGAFFWPLAPAMPDGMSSKHDLEITEAAPRGTGPGWFVSETNGASCDTVCAANGGRTCNEALLQNAGSTPEALNDAIRSTLACKLPILSSCAVDAPAVAASGSGTCWYHDNDAARCPGAAAPAKCNMPSAMPRRRLCPCAAARRRRQLHNEGSQPATAAAMPSSALEEAANSATVHEATASSVALLGLSALLLAAGGAHQRHGTLAIGAMWGLAAVVPTVRGHNWLQKPSSRADYASTVQPCPAKLGSAPNVQLNPGETFNMEWVIAHAGSRAYMTLVRAEDEAKLNLATKSTLSDYLNRAPSTSATTAMGITCGDHRAASCSACKTGKCEGECVFVGGACVEDPTNQYRRDNPAYPEGKYLDGIEFDKRYVSTGWGWGQKGANCAYPTGEYNDADAAKRGLIPLAKDDPRNIRRPGPYNCDDGQFTQNSRDRTGPRTGKLCRECNVLKQYVYKEVKHDQRAGYNSTKYPWIVSTTAVKLQTVNSAAFDMVKHKVPASAGPGNFIMQWAWGGYQDCVDIAVLPPKSDGTLAIADPSDDWSRFAYINATAKTNYARIDHCQFVRRTLSTKISHRDVDVRESAKYLLDTFGDKCMSDASVNCDMPIGVTPWPPNKGLGWMATVKECMDGCDAAGFPRYSTVDMGRNTNHPGKAECRCFTAYSPYRINTLHGGWAKHSAFAGRVQGPTGMSRCDVEEKMASNVACVPIPPPGERNSINQTDAEALETCKERGRRLGVGGLNMVPMVPPPRTRLSNEVPTAPNTYYNSDPASVNVAQGLNIPWGVGNCKAECFTNEPAGTKLCYPIHVFGKRFNAELDWQNENYDVEDEVWYSTCYRKNPERLFDTPCPQCEPSVVKQWRFQNSCVSCADVQMNSDPAAVPHWRLAPQGSCTPCFKALSDKPTFQLPPATQPENGWVSPDGALMMTWSRTTGTTVSVTFVVKCPTHCAADDGWLAVGPSPSNTMVSTHAVRWRFAGNGTVDEVRVSAQSIGGFEVVAPGNLESVTTTASEKGERTLTFTTAKIGDVDLPGQGNQMWAWAYRQDGGFTQHGPTVTDRGTAEMSFTLDPPPVPAPTTPPIFGGFANHPLSCILHLFACSYSHLALSAPLSDPAAVVENPSLSGSANPDPTAAPTLAPSLTPPDEYLPRIEATVTLTGCSVDSFADGSNVRVNFVAVLSAQFSLELKDIIVMTVEAKAPATAVAHRRLAGGGASEALLRTSVQFAVIGLSTSTPAGLLEAVSLFLIDDTPDGFGTMLQLALAGTTHENVGVAVDVAPTIANSAHAIGGDAGDAAPAAAAAAVLVLLAAVAALCCVSIAVLIALVAVIVVKRRRRASNSLLSSKTTAAAAAAEEVGDGFHDLSLVGHDTADGAGAFDTKPRREIEMQNPFRAKHAALDDVMPTASVASPPRPEARDDALAAAADVVVGANPMFSPVPLVAMEGAVKREEASAPASTSGGTRPLSMKSAQAQRAEGFAAAFNDFNEPPSKEEKSDISKDIGEDHFDDISLGLDGTEESGDDLNLDLDLDLDVGAESGRSDLDMDNSVEESIDIGFSDESSDIHL